MSSLKPLGYVLKSKINKDATPQEKKDIEDIIKKIGIAISYAKIQRKSLIFIKVEHCTETTVKSILEGLKECLYKTLTVCEEDKPARIYIKI